MPLLDPMCGSGTLLVEAAMMALRIAPGARAHVRIRETARLRCATVGAHHSAGAQQAGSRCRALPIFGSDLYGEQLKLARANLAAAGLAERGHAQAGQRAGAAAPGRVWRAGRPTRPMACAWASSRNWPRSIRKLGDALKAKYAGWSAWIFTADLRLPKLIGLKPSRRIPLYNGALECRLYGFEIVAGSMRRETATRQGEQRG